MKFDKEGAVIGLVRKPASGADKGIGKSFDETGFQFFMDDMAVDFNVFGSIMKCRIVSEINSGSIVTIDEGGVVESDMQVGE